MPTRCLDTRQGHCHLQETVVVAYLFDLDYTEPRRALWSTSLSCYPAIGYKALATSSANDHHESLTVRGVPGCLCLGPCWEVVASAPLA
jgi:hypothetical protein